MCACVLVGLCECAETSKRELKREAEWERETQVGVWVVKIEKLLRGIEGK